MAKKFKVIYPKNHKLYGKEFGNVRRIAAQLKIDETVDVNELSPLGKNHILSAQLEIVRTGVNNFEVFDVSDFL